MPSVYAQNAAQNGAFETKKDRVERGSIRLAGDMGETGLVLHTAHGALEHDQHRIAHDFYP
jgi:hypothetical protein